MFGKNEELQIVFIITTLVFVVFVGLIVCIILLHSRKVNRLFKEQLSLKMQYEQGILQSRLEVSEQVRVEVARELHDNISTLSSLIKINLNLINPNDSSEKNEKYIHESRELIKVLITEVKQLSVSLNSDRINALGLSQSLKNEIVRLEKLNLFSIIYQVNGEEWIISPDRQIIIFRVCQELLHNILKHAYPKNVSVRLDFANEKLEINMQDDGKGFDMSLQNREVSGTDGSGLINLPNRIKLIGGTIYWDSAPGKGTRSIVQIPKISS